MSEHRTPRQAAYDKFLDSPQWREIRQRAINHYGKSCQVCKKTRRIQMHHLFYTANWRETKIEHLMPVCDFHHYLLHRLRGRGITTLEADIECLRAKLIRNLPKNKRRRRRHRAGRVKAARRLAVAVHQELDAAFLAAIARDP